LKILKVYLEIITAALERLWSLASEPDSTGQRENESVEFSDDFDHFGASFAQSSNEELYSHLICKIFLKDCLAELLLMHLANSCHVSDVDGAEAAKPLPKLAKSVAQMLANFAENTINRLPVDDKYRIKIGEHCSEKLTMLIADGGHDGFVCSADFVDIVSSFVPIASPSALERLMFLLLHSPNECVAEQLEDGSRTLSHRGRLVVHVLQHILNRLDFMQPEILSGISVRLCKILKLVPADDTVCSSLTAVAKRLPQFASNITPGMVSSLLKSGAQPSLNLMMSLAVDNNNCEQMMVEWFVAHKMWKREDRLHVYVDAVSFVLKACEKGRMLTFFKYFVTHLASISYGGGLIYLLAIYMRCLIYTPVFIYYIFSQ